MSVPIWARFWGIRSPEEWEAFKWRTLLRFGRWGRERLIQHVIRPTMQQMEMIKPHRREFKTSWWIISDPLVSPESAVVPKGQWLTVDAVVLGPDGQLIIVEDLHMPTGRRWDRDLFLRRLGAELKRQEELGQISPIGLPTSYVKASVIDYRVYRVRRVPKRR